MNTDDGVGPFGIPHFGLQPWEKMHALGLSDPNGKTYMRCHRCRCSFNVPSSTDEQACEGCGFAGAKCAFSQWWQSDHPVKGTRRANLNRAQRLWLTAVYERFGVIPGDE